MQVFLRRLAGTVALFAALSAHGQSQITYTSTPGDFIGNGQSKVIAEPQFTFAAQVLTAAPGQFVRITVSGPDSYLLDLTAPPGQSLQVGTYEEAARASFAGASPGLDFSGEGR